ncbi:hypothetical protein [Sphingomonas sp.]|uniref:hypothetical protein n=1 Tax=Sphingomonas sp. TaxID=28214 RepID=UPI002DD61EEE|nr:hypothetical protein [Sphingomonas sp.]
MAASYRSSSYDARPSLRDRIAASGLSGAIIAGLIVALLWVTAPVFVDLGSGNPLTTFDVSAPQRAPTVSPPAPKPVQPKPAERRPPPPPAERPPPPPAPPVPVPTVPGMIVLSRDDFARSDIAGMRRKSADGDRPAEVADSGGGRPAYGPSEPAGGRTMHAADWYREPTRAEMITYMPPNQREGWGVIACQTAERYRVENCRSLGETPGSGIARGMRQAAFQFLVIPPRVDGRPQIGAWVRIRFDIVKGIEK